MKQLLIGSVLVMCSLMAAAQTGGNYTSQGRYEISRGRFASAIELLNRSIEMNSFNSEAYFLRGIAKFELDDFIGAEKDLGRSIELNPKNHEAFLYRGVCRSQLLNYRDAFTDYNESIRLNPDDWRTYSNRAMASLQLDRHVDVISDCNKVIELKKHTSHTYLLRGEAKAGLEMYKVAIEDFERAMKLDSIGMRPILHRGIARAKLKEFELAISDFEKAMELEPENALPVFHRAVVLAEMGKTEKALADLNAVLQRHPDNAAVLFNRAMVLTDLKRITAALADYDRVVQLSPNNILGYYNRGSLHLNRKDHQAALHDLNKAIGLFPEFLEAHENRAEVFRFLKDRNAFDAAMEELDAIKRRLSVSDDEAKYEQHVKLMKLTELKGDFEQTPQEVGKVQHLEVDVRLLSFYRISAFPETDRDILVYDGFDKPYYNMGVIAFTSASETRTDAASEALNRLTELPSSGPSQLVRSAPLFALTGDFNTAYKRLDECLKSDPDQVACYFARATLLQSELEAHQTNFELSVGSLDVVDTAYQARTERLLSLAESDYRKVIELDPQMRFAHFNLGHLLATAERYEEAETQFGKAASLAGNFIEANYNRGLIRILLGKVSKGCEDLSLAGELGLTGSYNIIKRFCE